ncbi:MAG: DUF6077 domain-containing protein [Eubacteriales bacterium]|jgi:hypothetical protein
MVILELLIVIVLLILLPLSIGATIFPEYALSVEKEESAHNRKSAGPAAVMLCLVTGNIVMWAVFQLAAVPCTLMKKSLTTAIVIWVTGIAAFIALRSSTCHIYPVLNLTEGWRRNPRTGAEGAAAKKHRDKGLAVLLILAAAVILVQCLIYIFGMHLDQDDSRFIANAVDAWQNDRLAGVNAANGNPSPDTIYGDYIKDSISPWSYYLAMMAKLCMIHPAAFAHTVFAPYLLVVSYCICFLLGGQLFMHDRRKTALFVLIYAICLTFFGGSTRTSGEFTLFRIWQGKAVVAAIGIPLIFLEFIWLYRSAEKQALPAERSGFLRIFSILLIADLACCLLSGMGIVLSAMMIGAMDLWYLIAVRKPVRFLLLLLTCAPSVVYALLTLSLKG